MLAGWFVFLTRHWNRGDEPDLPMAMGLVYAFQSSVSGYCGNSHSSSIHRALGNEAMTVVWVLFISFLYAEASSQKNPRPATVNIGSIFSFGTINGRVAKIAMKAAEEDINSDPSILGGSKIAISMHDSNYSGFMSIIGALQYMENDTVAIIGPQSSAMAHVLSHLANELHVPLLSFTALDPTLSPLQYPYFIQTAPNDLFQMAAIAEMIGYFGWAEVVAVYTDDDQFRNGISALSDKLAERRCKISYKAVLSPESPPNRDDVMNQLLKVTLVESRIIIIHAYSLVGSLVLNVAESLNMMQPGYVWIATSWLSTVLDSLPPLYPNPFQGVLTLRPHTLDMKKKKAFVSRWNHLSNGSIGLNPYGLYAYDTVWMIAHAVKMLWDQGGTLSFSNNTRLNRIARGILNIDSLSYFDGGKRLLTNVMRTNMTGVTGPIQFTADRSLSYPAFDVINVIGTGYNQIGYWSNYSGLSILPPEILYAKPPNRSVSSQQLHSVVWPGRTTEKPRGWVVSNNGRRLKIGVPNRVSYKEFVSINKDTGAIQGYCIDVFISALNLLPYGVPYEFVLFGNGHENPSYADFSNMITSNTLDAAVGDIAIVTNRTKFIDFTQPYIDSGLVVVALVQKSHSNAWAFLRPFTPSMWAVIALSFIVVGSVVWILEHRLNDEFRGPPRRQVVTVLWFSFSTLFFSHRENTVSKLGRAVLIIWLFVVLIINSSYTASLTSILTVQHLSSPIKGIETLIANDDRIGFQVGSFAENYMSEELHIPKSRLVALGTPDDYAAALENGMVSAVVDERPYIEVFLSDHCKFSIVGPQFTRGGWGFAFPRDSSLTVDMSTAILKLSENGELQKIHDKWLTKTACSVQSSEIDSDQLHLKSFGGLFLLCGAACFLALLIYFCLIVHQFYQQVHQESDPSGLTTTTPSPSIRTFLSFADERESENSRNKLKRKQMDGSLSRIVEDVGCNI